MNLCVIYDPLCPKMTENHYSRTYYDMFNAVIDRFDYVQHVTHCCSARDIEADVILVWDIHSSHHIVIDGLKDHKAVKYTYFNDPYQKGVEGAYRNSNIYVCKLGAERRTKRAIDRGIDYIICPYTEQYHKYIEPHLDKDRLVWFPPAPSLKRFTTRNRPFNKRKHEILANGITWGGDGSYDFRKKAYSQPEVKFISHAAYNKNVPQGWNYCDLLSMYKASLALCDHRIVPKYLEIPLAGCLCFAQYQEDYKRMGFMDFENCIYVNEKNFKERTRDFLNSNGEYEKIALNGQKLIEERWTAEKFADFLYEHSEKHYVNK